MLIDCIEKIFTYINRKSCRICINGVASSNADVLALLTDQYLNRVRIKGMLENYDDLADKFELDIITW